MDVIYVRDPGVLALVVEEYRFGVKARWFLDGICYTAFLMDDEYRELDEINDNGDDDD